MRNSILKYCINKVSKKFKIGTFNMTGKNFSGRTCVFGRGGRSKRLYRQIDFFRRLNLFGIISSVQYDPFRTSYIGLVYYSNGLMSYITLSNGLTVGNKIYSGIHLKESTPISQGYSISLSDISLFNIVSNIELRPYFGASLARAAGTGAILTDSNKKDITLKLRSGWFVKVPQDVVANLGYMSNVLHNMQNIGKAGKSRGLGKRPSVRGVAMNPCDHPHGGGNGKTSPPAVPVTPWGKFTKWTHTKNKKVDKLKRRLFKKIR